MNDLPYPAWTPAERDYWLEIEDSEWSDGDILGPEFKPIASVVDSLKEGDRGTIMLPSGLTKVTVTNIETDPDGTVCLTFLPD